MGNSNELRITSVELAPLTPEEREACRKEFIDWLATAMVRKKIAEKKAEREAEAKKKAEAEKEANDEIMP